MHAWLMRMLTSWLLAVDAMAARCETPCPALGSSAAPLAGAQGPFLVVVTGHVRSLQHTAKYLQDNVVLASQPAKVDARGSLGKATSIMGVEIPGDSHRPPRHPTPPQPFTGGRAFLCLGGTIECLRSCGALGRQGNHHSFFRSHVSVRVLRNSKPVRESMVFGEVKNRSRRSARIAVLVQSRNKIYPKTVPRPQPRVSESLEPKLRWRDAVED